MKIILINAMEKVDTPWIPFCSYCWYSDFWVNAVINYGVKMGWFWRVSVTQCGWTDEGINYIRQEGCI